MELELELELELDVELELELDVELEDELELLEASCPSSAPQPSNNADEHKISATDLMACNAMFIRGQSLRYCLRGRRAETRQNSVKICFIVIVHPLSVHGPGPMGRIMICAPRKVYALINFYAKIQTKCMTHITNIGQTNETRAMGNSKRHGRLYAQQY